MCLDFPALIFPYPQLDYYKDKGKIYCYDMFREKKIQLTPEEWVRQHVLHFFHAQLFVPKSHIAIEKSISLSKKKLRFDIGIFDKNLHLNCLIECKSAQISLQPAAIYQLMEYNYILQARYILVTNGLNLVAFQFNEKNYTKIDNPLSFLGTLVRF